ncbi:AAA family ATPase [Spirillospora sp. NPDC052269]
MENLGRQAAADDPAAARTPFTAESRKEDGEAGDPRRMLHGRQDERERLDGLLRAVRGGESRTLVLRGEPGSGKTALLNHLVGRARGFGVSRVVGVQSESKLAFAGLHQLCHPMTDHLPRIPAPQREALQTAFGLRAGPAPDCFLLGLAVLGLVSEASRNRPLLWVVDDAQWLDEASLRVLTFTARRLLPEPVAIVFATRVPDPSPEASADASPESAGSDPAGSDPAAALTGLPEMAVTGLPDPDARALLRAAVPGPWDDQVLARIVDETRGNPLALREMSAEASSAEFAGGFGPPGARASSGPIQDIHRRRVARLAPPTRQLLVVAAAEPAGDPVLLWRAADRLGIGIEAATPAVSAGLLHIGERLRFRHPLVRSAAYWTASPDERRRAHAVLAEVTDAETDPDRRAWHAAQAASDPAEDIAAELERRAGRARARGGAAAVAAFLNRAVELTPDPVRRRDRALTAAHAAHQAGGARAALRLLSIAEAGPVDRSRHGRIEQLRARIAFTTRRDADAVPLLLDAARRLEPHDVPLARDTYLEAMGAAMLSGGGRPEAAEAALSAPSAPGSPRPSDRLLDAMALSLAEGLHVGAEDLKAAVRAFRDTDATDEGALRWAWLAGLTAATLGDYETWDDLAFRHLRLALDTGRGVDLPIALTSRVVVKVFAGELAEAAALAARIETVSEAMKTPWPSHGALMLAAWQGREADAAKPARSVPASSHDGVGATLTRWAQAVLGNGLGRYQDVFAAMPAAQSDTAVDTWSLPEFVEAAVRSGAPREATAAVRRFGDLAQAAGTDWALGVHARSLALTSTDALAEQHYREAVERLGRTRVRGELARAHLLYGEWLRRHRRRGPAREQLRIAHEAFTAMGMTAFASRAARELLATGEDLRRRPIGPTGELTAQEHQIVRLVRQGLTNAEIGNRLYISPRTVEWHLRKIFVKLGVTSRRQLQRSAATVDA